MKQKRLFVADFETTVYQGQTFTEVWAAALVELGTEDVMIDNSIEDFFSRLKLFNADMVIYFHNLKFDGNFIIDYILRNGYEFNKVKDNDMKHKQFKCSISAKGIWYTITIKMGKHVIEIRDSLKLLPFSLKRIGKAFGTKHQKLEIEYEGFRYAGCTISEQEKKYIANDVLVIKEALELMFDEGHTKLTIGACCMDEFKKTVGKEDYKTFFQTCQWCNLTMRFMVLGTPMNTLEEVIEVVIVI